MVHFNPLVKSFSCGIILTLLDRILYLDRLETQLNHFALIHQLAFTYQHASLATNFEVDPVQSVTNRIFH